MTRSPAGIHCILELYGCPYELLDDEGFVRASVEQASEKGLSTLLSLNSHKFSPQGVTAVGLLAESHLAIHTWPERNYAAVDIFTCGEFADPRKACDFLVGRFKAERHSIIVLERGLDPAGEEEAKFAASGLSYSFSDK